MSAAIGPNSKDKQEPAQTPARKRRRRTVTTGAAEDCFACRKRQTRCDRVRPFCGQCRELGQECSGYRTTLTWGVGVASRGKLRGMTLPVAASEPEPKSSRSADAKADKSSSHGAAKAQQASFASGKDLASKRKRTPGSATDLVEAPQPIQPWIASKTWPLQTSQPNYLPSNNSTFSFKMEYNKSENSLVDSRGSRQSVSTIALSPSSAPIPYPDLDVQNEYTPTSSDRPTKPRDAFEHHSYQDNLSAPSSNASLTAWSNKPVYQAVVPPSGAGGADMLYSGHLHGIPSPADSHSTYPLFDEEVFLSSSFLPNRIQDELAFDDRGSNEGDEDYKWSIVSASPPSVPQALAATPFYEESYRMQYLLDFYDRAICPVLVTFDGPSNPYRDYILRMAIKNEGLQHAIAALVTNNIRMRGCEYIPWQRQRQERRALLTAPGQPSDEEQFHKTKSIKWLNEHLRSGHCSDDSVFATLLVLCLFHVCNSGLTKFKTQLAGVQKLLRMRRKRKLRSDFIGWVEMFFAWFDVMTSAVNNRETEIRGDSLDMTDFTANLGALEHYSGCDGRLFKLIARLGRLNLLSQNRPVRDEAMQGPSTRPGENARISWTEPAPSDDRDTFWREWHEVRARLYQWTFGQDSLAGQQHMSLPQQHIVDISEAFRWSALLYIERLAYPHLPSKSTNFQELVERSMSHIDAIGVNSCVTKFLLWPLFVTGTECVQERERDMIRERCVEIQKESGFYNNISGLQVLERMWHESDVNGQRLRAPAGQAFWWRTAMDRVDGEYVVI